MANKVNLSAALSLLEVVLIFALLLMLVSLGIYAGHTPSISDSVCEAKGPNESKPDAGGFITYPIQP